MTNPEIEEIVRGLTKAEREDLCQNWDAACDCDWSLLTTDTATYWDRMEADGFAELAQVDDDALEHPFAYELGIEPGGMMWRLTDKGESVRDHIMKEVKP